MMISSKFKIVCVCYPVSMLPSKDFFYNFFSRNVCLCPKKHIPIYLILVNNSNLQTPIFLNFIEAVEHLKSNLQLIKEDEPIDNIVKEIIKFNLEPSRDDFENTPLIKSDLSLSTNDMSIVNSTNRQEFFQMQSIVINDCFEIYSHDPKVALVQDVQSLSNNPK